MGKRMFFDVWQTVRLAACLVPVVLFGHVAKAQEPDWNEVQAGSLYYQSTDSSGERHWLDGVHLQTNYTADINGLLVNVELEQVFVNQTDSWQEAVYVLPMAEGSAVYAMEMHIGERVIQAEIQEKVAAQKTYEQAKSAGKKTALLQQQRPNLFTQRIANIAPGERIQIHVSYMDVARFVDGQFSWRLPTTLTPRYVPGKPTGPSGKLNDFQVGGEILTLDAFGWATATDQVSDAGFVTPFMVEPQSPREILNPFSVSIHLAAGIPLQKVSSPYHAISSTEERDGWRIRLASNTESMDRDFVLEWTPVAAHTPQAAAFHEQLDGEEYVMLMVLPPLAQDAVALSRDIIFVLDTSGSMAGESMRQAKSALLYGLRQLKATDRFNVVQFSDQFQPLFHGLQAADASKLNRAEGWLNSLQAGGGTEMQGALSYALGEFQADKAERLQQLVFITDGSVANESALFQTIVDNLGATRLFTVGIGSAPNSHFMSKSAQLGRGTFTYIGQASEAKPKMESLFTKLSGARASHVEAIWPGPVESFPAHIPDLYVGEPIMVTVKKTALQGELTVQANLGDGSKDSLWQTHLNLNDLALSPSRSGVAKTWARRKVSALEDSKLDGANAVVVREQVLALGLEHKLVTPYTSFVAVEQEISRPVSDELKTALIPNVLPLGQVMQPGTSVSSVPYPATATSLWLNVWLGLAAIVAAFAVRFLEGLRAFTGGCTNENQ